MGVEPIHVLGGVKPGDDFVGIELDGKGQLDAAAVHMVGRIELVDPNLELDHGRGPGQPPNFGPKSQGLAGLFLHPDVALRSRIVADNDGNKARDNPARLLDAGDIAGYLRPDSYQPEVFLRATFPCVSPRYGFGSIIP